MAIERVYRPISAAEVVEQMPIGEIVAIKELEREFGCHVETNVQVYADKGWFNLDAAVVRGHELVILDIHQSHGDGIAYFQVEHVLKLYEERPLKQFQGCVVYFVVVSEGSQESDDQIRACLEELTSKSKLETHIRLFRLEELRAKYRL